MQIVARLSCVSKVSASHPERAVLSTCISFMQITQRTIGFAGQSKEGAKLAIIAIASGGFFTRSIGECHKIKRTSSVLTSCEERGLCKCECHQEEVFCQSKLCVKTTLG